MANEEAQAAVNKYLETAANYRPGSNASDLVPAKQPDPIAAARRLRDFMALLNEMSFDEIKQAHSMVTAQWNAHSAQRTLTFSIGDKVKFDGGRRRGLQRGTVTGFGKRSGQVLVQVGIVNWKVGATLLTKDC
jgi:hypothetical protein